MRTCVIFNPVAKGDKARHFLAWLEGIATECTLKPTQCAGDARRLAMDAVGEGFEIIVAAGGDGTVNEVVDGIAAAPGGLGKVRFGVLPLGTVNVFAREMKIPFAPSDAWRIVKQAKEFSVDVPFAEFSAEGKKQRRHFIQMAGAGLDARAVELVSWELKKKIGPLAYVVAGLKALAERKPQISVRADGKTFTGELVLIGNGKLYGGDYAVHPSAEWANGKLEACIFPRVNFWKLLRIGPSLVLGGRLPESCVQRISAAHMELSSATPAAFELDGEWAGHLPLRFGLCPERLRILVP